MDENKKPNFSIIMPTYNRKHCIKDAIDSLLGQTYQNFELLIIDDASSDGTEGYIAENFKKEIESGKIRFIAMKENGGPSAARNEGLKIAKNEWIGYLDTDNKMRSDFLETYAKATQENPTNEIFYAQIRTTDSMTVIGQDFDFEKLLTGNYIDVGVLVHSKKIHSELGGFDINIKGVEDWDLIIRYTEKYSPKFISKVVLDYYDSNDFERITPNAKYEENFKKVINGYYNRLSPLDFLQFHKNVRNEIESKNQEIEMMKSSKFWKLRDVYMTIIGAFLAKK